MTNRIYNHQRKVIISNIKASLFVKERKAMVERELAFYHEVADHSLGKHLKIVKSLPIKLVKSSSTFWPTFGGCSTYYTFEEERPFVLESFPSDHKLAKKFTKLENDKKDLQSKIDEVTNSAGSVIYSCTTFKKLLETWPEVEEYTPKHFLKEQNVGLPAIQIKDVNKLLKQAVKK